MKVLQHLYMAVLPGPSHCAFMRVLGSSHSCTNGFFAGKGKSGNIDGMQGW